MFRSFKCCLQHRSKDLIATVLKAICQDWCREYDIIEFSH